MIVVVDTVGYCPETKKWFLYNAEMRSMGGDNTRRLYYDSFDAAVAALKTIREEVEIL